jgi:excisionase family DNA binding protein
MRERRAFRLSEAAELLGTSRWTVARAIHAGHVRAIRLGPRTLRIPADELERIIREGVLPGPAGPEPER